MTYNEQDKRQPLVSLQPLKPVEALAGLMQVKPKGKNPPADEKREEEGEPETKEST